MTRRIAAAYRPEKLPADLDVVVIGSGIAGLASASCLAQQGAKVLVLERHGVPGGMTHSFRRKGYSWDVGLHYVGRVLSDDPVARAMQHVTRGGVSWAAMPDEYDVIEYPNERFGFVRGQSQLKAVLDQRFPNEGLAIARYFKLMQKVGRAMQFDVLGRALSENLGDWFGRLASWPLRRIARQSTAAVLAELTEDAQLVGILTSQWGNYGAPPAESSFAAHALVARHYLEGGAYPVGGSASVARGIVPIIEDAGGRVLVRAEVDEIIVEGEGKRERAVGVRMSDGQEIRAGHVICAAGAWATHGRMLRNHPRLGRTALTERPPSTAHFALFMGAEGESRDLGLTAANTWIYPGFDHDANVRAHRRDASAEFPVMFMSSGSAKDPQFSATHGAKSTLEAIVPADHSVVAQWAERPWQRRGAEYEAFKRTMAGRIRACVRARFPDFEAAIRWSELSTPLTTNHFCATRQGEIYGLGGSPRQFAQSPAAAARPLPGLVLAGQDSLVFGVGGALFSGVLAARAVAGLAVLKQVFSPQVLPQVSGASGVFVPPTPCITAPRS